MSANSQERLRVEEHLADLRKRIIYTLVAFGVLFAAGLAFVSRLYDFFVRPLTRQGYHLVVISPGEVIMVYFAMAAIVGIGLTLPFALYQLWRFVAPGLTARERRYTVRLIPVSLLMFACGVCFAWFFIFPTVLSFLLRLSAQHFQVMMRADAYFSFLTNICLPFGFIFELPIVVVFLTRIGIVTPGLLRRWRRYAYLVCVILGVLISPPELVSHLSVVLPMIALYELSIGLSVVVKRRRDEEQHRAEAVRA